MSCSLPFSALLIMCCLLAARGEGSETELSKLMSFLAHNFASTNAMFAELKSDMDAKFDSMDAKIAEIKSDVGELKSDVAEIKSDVVELKSGLVDLREITYQGFQSTYTFDRERVEDLRSACTHVHYCGGSGTQLTLFYKGRVASVFTPHTKCTNLAFTENASFIFHEKYDLALDITCDTNPLYALDISEIATPLIGDGVIAFGYGDAADSWKGIVAGFQSRMNCTDDNPAKHWTGETRMCDGEIMAQGHQHEGMSGAPVLNGCGYIGMAHCALTPYSSKLANFAGIIPAAAIQAFLEVNLSKLPTLEECNKTVISPLIAPFVNCSHAASATQTSSNPTDSPKKLSIYLISVQ